MGVHVFQHLMSPFGGCQVRLGKWGEREQGCALFLEYSILLQAVAAGFMNECCEEQS